VSPAQPQYSQQEAWSRERAQLDSLTGLRILAAVWVMLHHFRDVTPTKTWSFPLIDGFILHGGRYGVDLFFVLSGFILSHVYFEQFREGISRAGFRSFLSYRFARLYPVHIVTFLMMVVLFVGALLSTGISSTDSNRYSVWTFLATLTMTHAWWAAGMGPTTDTVGATLTLTPTPNVPAWSISAEWFAYLLFPVLCLVIARLRVAPVLFVVAGCGLAVVWEELTGHLLIRVMAGFLVGMAAYRLAHHSTKLARIPALGVVIVALIVLWTMITDPPRVEIGILLFAALVLALTSERDWFGRMLSRRTMVYLGEVSYAVYMVHWIVRVAVRQTAEKAGVLDTIPPGLIVATYIVVTVLAAIALYHFVERPWRRRLRRMLAPRTTARPVVKKSLAGESQPPRGQIPATAGEAGGS